MVQGTATKPVRSLHIPPLPLLELSKPIRKALQGVDLATNTLMFKDLTFDGDAMEALGIYCMDSSSISTFYGDPKSSRQIGEWSYADCLTFGFLQQNSES